MPRAVSTKVSRVGRDKLVREARGLIQIAKDAHIQTNTIPKSLWPSVFHSFEPVEVQYHMFGILIVTEKVKVDDLGVYVIVENRGDPPEGGSGVSYHKIGSFRLSSG